MYDDQISLDLTKGGGLGLADMITQQLGGTAKPNNANSLGGQTLEDYRAFSIQRLEAASSKAVESVRTDRLNNHPEPSRKIDSPGAFVSELWSHAQQAAEELGVDPKVLLAQSALETGWGKHVMRNGQGESSHNLFGIKASAGWTGKTVSVPTLEYEGGVAVKRQATFRAYDSYQDSFNDYVQFLKQNPRYQQALEKAGSSEGFIKGLQKAGYATDPAYAKKIISILGREQMTSYEATIKKSGFAPIKG
jgi:flagellar protein FlgJ